MKNAIINYFESREDEIVRLATDLISANTTNPPGNEVLAANMIKEYFQTRGIRYDVFEKEEGRTNIVGYIGSGGPKLLVVCHLDVVPAGDGWTSNPFEAVVKNRRIYGRGASDNKGQMAPMLMLAGFLKDNEPQLNGSFILVGAADEEKGSNIGIKYLLDECNLTADYAIIPDIAHNMQIITVGEKGTLFLEITSKGKQAHGSTPEKGTNAIWNMVELLNGLKKFNFKCISHDLFSPPTINLGTVSGGAAVNIVPAKCKVGIDMRYLPGESKEEILHSIQEIITEIEENNPTANFEIAIDADLPPALVSTDNPLIELIAGYTETVLGVKPGTKGLSGTTVAKQLIEKGITAVGFGPGDDDQAHVANESIEIKELVDFGKIMGLITFDLLKIS